MLRKEIMQTRTSLILGLCSLLLTFSCTTEDEIIPVQADFESTELPTNIKLIEIPAGTFTMGGATKVGDAPTVSVTLSKFQISEKETTNQEYIDFLNSAYLDGFPFPPKVCLTLVVQVQKMWYSEQVVYLTQEKYSYN